MVKEMEAEWDPSSKPPFYLFVSRDRAADVTPGLWRGSTAGMAG